MREKIRKMRDTKENESLINNFVRHPFADVINKTKRKDTKLFNGNHLSSKEKLLFLSYNYVVLTAFLIVLLVAIALYPYKKHFIEEKNINFSLLCIFISNLGNPTVLDKEVGPSYRYLIFNTGIILFGILVVPVLCSLYMGYNKIRYLGYTLTGISSLGLVLIGIYHQGLIGDRVHFPVTLIGCIGFASNFVLLFILETRRVCVCKKNRLFYLCKWVPIITFASICLLTSVFKPVVKKGDELYGPQFQTKFIEWSVISIGYIWLYIQTLSIMDLRCLYPDISNEKEEVVQHDNNKGKSKSKNINKSDCNKNNDSNYDLVDLVDLVDLANFYV